MGLGFITNSPARIGTPSYHTIGEMTPAIRRGACRAQPASGVALVTPSGR
ncbi:MAG: hypothetical protein IT496_11980 [Gammaproteobacteria bacterium]|nr:hypothetical protein [Gammaproteobacteria bacterium]